MVVISWAFFLYPRLKWGWKVILDTSRQFCGYGNRCDSSPVCQEFWQCNPIKGFFIFSHFLLLCFGHFLLVKPLSWALPFFWWVFRSFSFCIFSLHFALDSLSALIRNFFMGVCRFAESKLGPLPLVDYLPTNSVLHRLSTELYSLSFLALST